MIRIIVFILINIILISNSGCVNIIKSSEKQEKSQLFIKVSNGLPEDGQYRQNIILFDINNDGFFDIVTPPKRLASKEEKFPNAFVFNNNKQKWDRITLKFPDDALYDYGGIAVDDIDKDGDFDIVFAIHNSKIVILRNDGKNNFSEESLVINDKFFSRSVGLADVNNDSFLDIIAFSESDFSGGKYKPAGILLAINNNDEKKWDTKLISESKGLFGDFFALGDVNGDNKIDIILAPLAYGEWTRLIWFGDGSGNFTAYKDNIIGNELAAYYVKAGDIDGDKTDEIFFKLIGLGRNNVPIISAYKWDGKDFKDISKGLDLIENPVVFDVIDTDKDGKGELIVLNKKGLCIYKYSQEKWIEKICYELPYEEVGGAIDLKAKRNKDGSVLIVYNLGKADELLHRGIRAFLLR